MVKSAAPVFVLLFAFLFGLEKLSISLCMSILIICLGVGIMVAAETNFNAIGYAEAQSATIISGFRWALTNVLLKSPDLCMDNPLATNMFLSPVVAFCLLLGFLLKGGVSELASSPLLQSSNDVLFICSAVLGGGAIAFLMVNIEFALISNTNVVTFSVAGIFKEIFTIWSAILVFGDQLGGNSILGLAISLVGIAGNNYLSPFG